MCRLNGPAWLRRDYGRMTTSYFEQWSTISLRLIMPTYPVCPPVSRTKCDRLPIITSSPPAGKRK